MGCASLAPPFLQTRPIAIAVVAMGPFPPSWTGGNVAAASPRHRLHLSQPAPAPPPDWRRENGPRGQILPISPNRRLRPRVGLTPPCHSGPPLVPPRAAAVHWITVTEPRRGQ